MRNKEDIVPAKSKKNLLFGGLIILLLASMGAAAFLYTQVVELKQDPQRRLQQEAEDLIERVGRLVVLPVGERPTIATVSDIEQVKDRPFFANAKNGDKVLIYTNARKAILYDPVNDKIVEIAPVNIGTAPPPGTEAGPEEGPEAGPEAGPEETPGE